MMNLKALSIVVTYEKSVVAEMNIIPTEKKAPNEINWDFTAT